MSLARRAAALAGLAVLAAPAAGEAQPAPRTGPEAQPPPLPAFPQPSPGLPRPGPQAAAAIAGGGAVSEVQVEAAGPHGPVRPPRRWTPPQDPAGALRLEHSRGEQLDEAWVRRQFAANGVPGPGASVGRALALVQLINRAYLSAGFINSGVVVRPAAAPGALNLAVVYGGLAPPAEGAPALTVEWAAGGSKGLDAGYVRERMASAFRRPLNAAELEREFRLLAEDPAIRTVNADLRPGSRPGEASLALSVYPQDRFDLYLTAANNRSPSVGGERIAAGGSVRNLLAAGSLLTAEVGVTEGLEDAAAAFALPFLDRRNTLSLRAAYNDAAVVEQALAPLDIEARDHAVEGGLTRKLIDAPLLPAEGGGWRPARTLSVGMLATRRVSKTFLLGQPFSFSPGSVNGRSEYTAVRLIGDYVVRNVDQVLAISLTATQGLDGSRSDVPGVLSPRQDFRALLAQVNYARRLSADGLELRGRFAGQIADSILYSGERFSAGGETTVRGYRENLLLADNGAIGSVELARPFSLSRDRGRGGFDWGAFAGSVFADGAYLRNHRAPHPQRWIGSLGASLAWTPSDAVNARITYAYALEDVPVSGEKDIQDRGFHFRVTVYPLRLRR